MQMKYLLLYPSEVTLFFLFVQKGQSTISWVLLCAFHFHDNGLNPLGRWKMTFARICIRRLAFVSGNSNVSIGLFWLIKTVRKKQHWRCKQPFHYSKNQVMRRCKRYCQRAIRAKTLGWRGGSRIEPRKTGLRGRKILDRAEKCVTWSNVDSPGTKWSVVNQLKYKISHNSRRLDFLCLFT